MLEWLVVKIDELLAISVRIAVALEGLTHETRLQRLLIADSGCNGGRDQSRRHGLLDPRGALMPA